MFYFVVCILNLVHFPYFKWFLLLCGRNVHFLFTGNKSLFLNGSKKTKNKLGSFFFKYM